MTTLTYLEITLRLSDLSGTTRDLIPYHLESLGFEGFNDSGDELIAYIPSAVFDRHAVYALLNELDIPANSISESVLPEKNWNEEWEKNFEPVVIDDLCLIRATFHTPEKTYPYEIIIEPKMSFGTGHHATTSLMISELLHIEMKNKVVLDSGCGTGILAILAEFRGAQSITAVDIDSWSYRNALENIAVNHCNRIKILQGDATDITGETFDTILANINLNILIAGMEKYAALLNREGCLLMSGIHEPDVVMIKQEADKHGLVFDYSKTRNNWALASFKKK